MKIYWAISALCFWTVLSISLASGADGLLAEWKFDEGTGTIARDTSGGGHDAVLHGASWVKQGAGYCVSLDGTDDYINCAETKQLDMAGPFSIEFWIKPTRKGKGEAHLLGEGISSYGLTYYNTELCMFYVSGGGNQVKQQLTLHKWQHVAATFDGKRLGMWVNGRQVAGAKSKQDGYQAAGLFGISGKGPPEMPRFMGLIDNVRVYRRAISEEDILRNVMAEAEDHDLSVGMAQPVAVERATEFFESHPNPIDVQEQGDSVLIANRRIGLEFVKSDRGFQINRLYGIEQDHDFLVSDTAAGMRQLFEIRMTPDLRGSNRDERWKTVGSLMGIMDEMAEDAFSVGSQEATSVSWSHEEKEGSTVLRMKWHQIPVRGNTQHMDVEVTVTLRENDPMSYWRINIKNPGVQFGLERVRFPLLSFAPIGATEDDVYIYPREHGGLVEDPFNAPTGFGLPGGGAYYPIHFNMQFQALYDKPSGKGVYLATQDPTPNLMQMRIANTPKEITWQPGHFPPNITYAEEDYHLPYDCVAGPFQGDWYDAAQIYRKWAQKQYWCRKGPLLTREDVPRWYKESPFVFYTTIADSAEGTHSMPENMAIAADHFREYLKWAGIPLAAKWYGWKDYTPGMTSYDVPFGSHRLYNQGRWRGLPAMNIHDGNYPKIGALEAFTQYTHRLRKEGGMVCPYVALEIFDQGPAENSPYAAEARPNVVRDLYGKFRTWGNETAWQACCATPWWQNRLRETCELLVKREHVGGLYLDVMQGSGLPCYWTPHGHSAAGGDSTTTGMHQLVEGCFNAAKKADPQTIITGENCTENMFDVIDGTLQVTLWPENKAHIFAAVYQDYIKRYGTELATGVGYQGRYTNQMDADAFFIECASLFVQGAQIGRIRLRPRDASLSLTDPEQAPQIAFLEQVLGYYKNEVTKMFIAYGRFMRPLSFDDPAPMPQMTYIRGGEFPTLWSGVFRNAQGELGIFLVNASQSPMSFQANFDPARYELPEDATINGDYFSPSGEQKSLFRNRRGPVKLDGVLAGREIHMIRIQPIGN